MYESLIESIISLQKSKYGKGNKRRLSYVLGALHQAKPIFSAQTLIKQISFRNIPLEEQIPKILEYFIDSFVEQCLQRGNNTAKNYSLFSIISLKIIKTMEDGKKRGLASAHALNKLNEMFAKYSVKYSKQAIRDPLGIIFAITELAVDVQKNLGKEYEFDQSILDNIAPFMQRYYLEYDLPVKKILQELSDMPKSRMVVEIDKKHQQTIEIFLQHSIVTLSLESRIKKAKDLLEKIITEENDTTALEYYNTLKLSFGNSDISPHISKIAKELNADKRFASSILEEVSRLT